MFRSRKRRQRSVLFLVRVRWGPFVYIGGQWHDKADAKISVYDHGFLYGDGVFEGSALHRQDLPPRRVSERLYESAKRDLPRDPDEQGQVAEATYESLKQNNLSDAYVRLASSAGAGLAELRPQTHQRSAGHHHRRHQALPGGVLQRKASRSSPRAPSATTRKRSTRESRRSTTLGYIIAEDRGDASGGRVRSPDAQPQG